MRVAYVCADPGVPVFGSKGASVHVQGVVGALTRHAADTVLVARRLGGERPVALREVDVRTLPAVRAATAADRERLLAAGNDALAACLDAAGPFDLVVERHALWSWAAMEWARATGVPSVLEVNAPLVAEQARHRALADVAGAHAGVRRALSAAGSVLAVSDEVARRTEAYAGARGKVTVVPNGIDPARFAARPRRDPRRPFTVAFVGTLKPWHGLDTLVAAFAALRREVAGARLLIVGDGPGREALVHALRVAGQAEAATLTGAVGPEAVPALLARTDAGVAPYPADADHYFSPLKVVEYMAAGLPVVASRIGQIPRLVRDGVTGRLCPPGDPEALAGALRDLARAPAAAARMGAAGRLVVLRDHTWDRVAEAIARSAAAAPVEAAA